MASTAMVITAFDPNAEKYKCCCRHTLCTTGLKVLLVLQIVGVVLNLISMLSGSYAQSIIDIILGIALAACLYMALRTETHTWLIPQLIVTAISIAFLVIGAILALLFTIIGSEWFREALIDADPRYREIFDTVDLTLFGILLAILFVVCALVEIWLFTVIKGAYDFYKEQASYRAAAAIAQAQQPGPYAPPPDYSATDTAYPQK